MAKIDVPESPGATAEVIEQGSDTQVQRVSVEAGGRIPPHAHDVSSSYVVLKGKARFVGPRECAVGPGSVVHAPAGEVHGWDDVGPDTLEFVSVFNGPGVVDQKTGSWDLQLH